jgi:hypothetical protein
VFSLQITCILPIKNSRNSYNLALQAIFFLGLLVFFFKMLVAMSNCSNKTCGKNVSQKTVTKAINAYK